jgi:superfamily I DNA and/or RNA helicase
MIERLEGIEMYKDDPRIMTMLRQNYRSHPAIIEVPSRLFYNNELVASKDVKTRERLANWGALPKKVPYLSQ